MRRPLPTRLVAPLSLLPLLAAHPALAAAPPQEEGGKSAVSAFVFLAVFVLIALANLAIFRTGRLRWRSSVESGYRSGFGGFGGGFSGFGSEPWGVGRAGRWWRPSR